MIQRIILTGPESTGKSALTTHLAARFKVPFALEYARIYLEEHGPSYTYDLLLTMSRGHLKHQRATVPDSARLGVLDTDLINYKIWCEVVYGRCHEEILARLEQETTHAYLLCYPDLPWTPDPLRENPDDREVLFNRHVAEIERLGRPYVVIKGEGAIRYAAAEAGFLKLTGGKRGAEGAGR